MKKKKVKKCHKCGSNNLRKMNWTPKKPQEKHGSPMARYGRETREMIYNRKWKGVYICRNCGAKSRFAR